MKKGTLLPLIGYALSTVSFLVMFVLNLIEIPSLFEADFQHIGNFFIALTVAEGFFLLLSVWGLLGTIMPLKKWTMPFVFVILVILGSLAFPLISLSLQTGDNPASEMNLLLLALFPYSLWAYVSIGNVPGAVLILIGNFQKIDKLETPRPDKNPMAIDFGAKDEMSLEVERFKTLFKEGLISEEEAQKQIRELEPTIL